MFQPIKVFACLPSIVPYQIKCQKTISFSDFMLWNRAFNVFVQIVYFDVVSMSSPYLWTLARRTVQRDKQHWPEGKSSDPAAVDVKPLIMLSLSWRTLTFAGAWCWLEDEDEAAADKQIDIKCSQFYVPVVSEKSYPSVLKLSQALQDLFQMFRLGF